MCILRTPLQNLRQIGWNRWYQLKKHCSEMNAFEVFERALQRFSSLELR